MRSRMAVPSVTAAAGSWLSSCSIVRGPMIAEVTAGWLTTKAIASSMSGTPASPATAASCSTASSLRWFSASGLRRFPARRQVEARGEPLARGRGRQAVGAPAARQPAAGQRAVGEDPHAVALRGRQHVELDATNQQRVGRLLGAEALQAPLARGPLGVDDLPGVERRGADVADLALRDEVGQCCERLVDVGVRVGAVQLVEVDVVGVEPPQRALDLLDDPPA